MSHFTDEQQRLDHDGVKPLFDYVWKQLETDHRSDIELVFASVAEVAPRFHAELSYLSRQLRHQGRSVQVLNVGPSIERKGSA